MKSANITKIHKKRNFKYKRVLKKRNGIMFVGFRLKPQNLLLKKM